MKTYFRKYFEVIAFSTGLVLLALMDPHAASGPSFCLFDQLGVPFCPGEGLGHSIAFIFRGEFSNALQANILGPFALVILGARIIHLLIKNHNYNNITFYDYGSND